MAIQLDQYNNLIKVNDSVNTNAPIVLQPQGTGAVQAQLADSTATGGNARGANAVDWQTQRNLASQIASGANSTISGGGYNTANASLATISGGTVNTASGYGSFVGAGNGNIASGVWSSVVAGALNSSLGTYNFIGGGFTNSGTANAAVTTQATSTITSGSTAVTLSGSNASIKVGQYVTGTPIASDTYVAAISGTSLTLSKNATSSTNATLSFYTPHGVVVGGGNNQATGSYSFIGGGGDAGTAANRNVASGDWSVVCGGIKNIASGPASFVGGGGYDGTGISGNTAAGTASAVVCGYVNNASNIGAFIGGGTSHTNNANLAFIGGGAWGLTRGIVGNHVFPACNAPISATAGVQQSALLILGAATTDATATVLRSNTAAAGTNNQLILPNNSAYYVRGSIVAGVTGGGNTSSWTFQGTIKRGANAASTALVGAMTATLVTQDAGASTWAVSLTADTTNGGLAVTVTGQAATTIRWVCKIETTEMTY